MCFSASPTSSHRQPRQKELCAQRDVFFSLPLDAFQGVLPDSSLLAPLPDRVRLAGGCEGNTLGKGWGGVAREKMFSGLAMPRTRRVSPGQVYDRCVSQGENAVLLRNPQICPLMCKKLKSEHC